MMTPINKRRLFAVGAVLAIVLIIGGLALLSNHRKQASDTEVTNVDTGSRYDPSSGETISDPKGKTPDKYGTLQDAPVFLGVSSLLDYGVTSDQLGDLKYGLYTYLKTNDMKASQVSVIVDTVEPVQHDPNSSSTVDTINFNVMVDNKTTYKVRMDYFDLTAAQIYVSDISGTQLYDSGKLDGKTI